MNISRLHMLTLLSMCGGAVTAHGAHQSATMLTHCDAQQGHEAIKAKMCILFEWVTQKPKELHPKNALRLLIVLVERCLAIEHRQDVEEFYTFLQDYLQKDLSDARAVLCAIIDKAPTHLIPEDVAQKVKKLSPMQQLTIFAAFKAHTYKNKHPQDNIEYLEEMVFARS